MSDETRPIVGTPAVVDIGPEHHPGYQALQFQIEQILAVGKERKVENDADVKTATEDLIMIAKLKKALEESRQEYVAPLNRYVKSINATFATLSRPLDEADKMIRWQITAYASEMRRRAAEAEEINRLRQEAADRERELTGAPSEPVPVIEVPTAEPTRVFTESGTLSTAGVWKYEVIDFKAVPDEYKMIDANRLNRAVKGGLHTIAGVRIWQEPGLRVTAKP
jgi:hypothetical protein